MEDKVKMVIVARKDLGLSSGKLAAQCAHAAMLFILRRFQTHSTNEKFLMGEFTQPELYWLRTSFTKVVCYADNEAKLLQVHDNALAAGIEVHKMIDNGLSEVTPLTLTCIALGPDYSSKIDLITKRLRLV